MKKSLVLSVAVAALVGISSTCFAGFGVPGLPKAPKAANPVAAKSPAASSDQGATVDLSDITAKQAKVLKYALGGLYAQCRAYMVVDEALGVSDSELAAAAAGLKGGKNGDAKKAKTILAKKQTNAAAAYKAVEKNKVQVENLAKAIKIGKAYQQAAIVNYGFVAGNAPKALNEATGALKGLGSNPTAASKVNGAISTYKLGIELSGAAQKVAGGYNNMVDTMKNDFGVSQEALNAAQAPNIEAVATDCLNFVEGK